MSDTVSFTIVQSDITTYPADIVVLKYAQAYYGVDGMVADTLSHAGIAITTLQPLEGDFCMVESRGTIRADKVLFVGVSKLSSFRYKQIQEFSQRALRFLANASPGTQTVAMTLHGVGYGLDEKEAVRAEFAGIVQALYNGEFPGALGRIAIVEKNQARVERLRTAIEGQAAADPNAERMPGAWAYSLPVKRQQVVNEPASPPTRILMTGEDADAKPSVFVAMPFLKETEDTYFYGIEGPVHAAGFSCERIDHAVFTGSIFDSIRQRIERASVVIADLTSGNPNVYLEVGYAWGKGRPTILLTKNVDDLPFDVRGHKCLKYSTLKELEKMLTEELTGLKVNRLI